MTTFRDAIAKEVLVKVTCGPAADAVLAMPEMQAIRKVLKRVAQFGIGSCDAEALMEAYYDLHDNVFAWALDDE